MGGLRTAEKSWLCCKVERPGASLAAVTCCFTPNLPLDFAEGRTQGVGQGRGRPVSPSCVELFGNGARKGRHWVAELLKHCHRAPFILPRLGLSPASHRLIENEG